jgi:DNA-binding CsgD family transcriptional regulator/tetratricopeptide (TPR) repeat protein
VPERFRSAVAAHIRPLSDPARRLVDVASVLGRRFPLGDLAALLGRPVGRLLGEIEEARRAGILIDVGEDLTFRHDLLREAVYAGLPSSVRQALHRDAAAAMLARGADTVSVAAHVAVGAVPGDEQAVRMLERAAAELKGSNPSAAADLACQALDLRAPDDPERPARAAQVVDLLAWAGRPDQAVPLAEQTLASGPLDPNVEATLLAGIRLSILIQGETIRHLAPLPPRLLADPSLSPTLARTLRHFDAFGRRYTDFDGADQVCKAVAEEAAAAGDDVNLAGVNRACSFFSSARGDLTGALRLAEAASAAAQRGSADAKQRGPLGDVSAALFALDRLDEALEVLDRALSAAEHYSRGMVSDLEIIRAHILLAAGRLDEALVEADSAATDAEDSRRTPAPPVALLELQAEVAVQRGDMATARAAAEEIASLLEAGRADLPCYWPMALVADADGRPGDALKMMSKTLDALAAGRYFLGVPHYDSLPRLASIALRAGERAAAETVTRAAGTLADFNPGVPGIAGAAAHCVGLLERSEPDLRRAVATLAASPRPLAAAAAMEDLAALLETTGDRPAVIDLRQSAYQIYDRTGAARDADRVRGELLRLGVLHPPTVEKARHGWESLSPAELAVVQVVAEGVTSQVAAERLYLSVNTVNTHLRHAFAKLGVRSRVGLTRIVLAHQPTTS